MTQCSNLSMNQHLCNFIERTLLSFLTETVINIYNFHENVDGY